MCSSGMSICRAPVCHRLESNAQRGESEIVPAKRIPVVIYSTFEYAISGSQVPGVGEIVTNFHRCIDGPSLCQRPFQPDAAGLHAGAAVAPADCAGHVVLRRTPLQCEVGVRPFGRVAVPAGLLHAVAVRSGTPRGAVADHLVVADAARHAVRAAGHPGAADDLGCCHHHLEH